LIDTIKTYSQTRPDLRLLIVDEFQKYNDVLANPAQYGFTEAIIPALDDPALTDKSFTGPGADYVQWDCCHVTSKFHKLIAAWNLVVLTNSILEKLEATIASVSPAIQMNRLQIGRDYTLQRTVDLKSSQEVASFTASAGTNLWLNAEGNQPTACLPTGNDLNGIAYGNGQFVAVGEYGTIVTSADGTNWLLRQTGTTDWLSDSRKGYPATEIGADSSSPRCWRSRRSRWFPSRPPPQTGCCHRRCPRAQSSSPTAAGPSSSHRLRQWPVCGGGQQFRGWPRHHRDLYRRHELGRASVGNVE
jgi:hypothetical protein